MTDIIKIQNPDKVWFTSDSHFEHVNITYGESVWANKETGCRRFNTTKEMSKHVVEQINKYVNQDDILIHLGDWSFGGIENIWNFRKQIKCKNIYLVLGNHDHHIRNNKELLNTEKILGYVGGDIMVMGHKYAHELFITVEHYLEVLIDNTLFCCMHFPIEEWNDRHRKSYMLHGHSHGNSPIKKDRLDVGIDNIYKLFGEYKPINYKDLMQYFNNQK